jgi:hypothetical protein
VQINRVVRNSGPAIASGTITTTHKEHEQQQLLAADLRLRQQKQHLNRKEEEELAPLASALSVEPITIDTSSHHSPPVATAAHASLSDALIYSDLTNTNATTNNESPGLIYDETDINNDLLLTSGLASPPLASLKQQLPSSELLCPFSNDKEGNAVTSDDDSLVPVRHIMSRAVLVPCCGYFICCEDCIGERLMNKSLSTSSIIECPQPNCLQEITASHRFIPHKPMRQRVDAYLAEQCKRLRVDDPRLVRTSFAAALFTEKSSCSPPEPSSLTSSPRAYGTTTAILNSPVSKKEQQPQEDQSSSSTLTATSITKKSATTTTGGSILAVVKKPFNHIRNLRLKSKSSSLSQQQALTAAAQASLLSNSITQTIESEQLVQDKPEENTKAVSEDENSGLSSDSAEETDVAKSQDEPLQSQLLPEPNVDQEAVAENTVVENKASEELEVELNQKEKDETQGSDEEASRSSARGRDRRRRRRRRRSGSGSDTSSSRSRSGSSGSSSSGSSSSGSSSGSSRSSTPSLKDEKQASKACGDRMETIHHEQPVVLASSSGTHVPMGQDMMMMNGGGGVGVDGNFYYNQMPQQQQQQFAPEMNNFYPQQHGIMDGGLHQQQQHQIFYSNPNQMYMPNSRFIFVF